MVQITAELTTGLQVRISDGRHEWLSDEPREAGGDDTGPNPYEMLLGGLAACTCITLALYCRYKGIKLKSVGASYELARVHAKDCEDCDERRKGFIDHITSHIRIAGDFNDAQRKRLAQVAERCPVHKTLASEVQFTDNVVFA